MKQGEKAEVPNYTRTGLTINGNRSEGVMNPNVKVVSVWTAVVRDTTAHVYKRGEGSVMILGYISAIGVEGQKSIE